jgi:hypothetical protein
MRILALALAWRQVVGLDELEWVVAGLDGEKEPGSSLTSELALCEVLELAVCEVLGLAWHEQEWTPASSFEY